MGVERTIFPSHRISAPTVSQSLEIPKRKIDPQTGRFYGMTEACVPRIAAFRESACAVSATSRRGLPAYRL